METVAATAVAGLIYYISGSFLHIVIGVSLAPFLLLQTPISSRRTVKFVAAASRAFPKIMVAPLPDPQRLDGLQNNLWKAIPIVVLLELYFMVTSLSLYFVFIVASIAAKATFAVIGLFSAPLVTLSHFPDNWRRAVLYTDSHAVPELVPGLDDHPGANDFLPLSLKEILGGPGNRLAGILFFAAILYLPAVSYRWSLKATALIWSPLLWAFRPLGKKEDPDHFAKGIVQLTRYRAARAYSTLIGAAFLLKIVTLFAWTQVASSARQIPGWEALSKLVAPETIPLWHIAAFVNAVLTWTILFRSEQYLHEASGPNPIPQDHMQKFFVATFVIRNVLTIYVLVCTMYLILEMAGLINFPRIRVLLFPWN